MGKHGAMNPDIGVYIHAPFCVKKCPYCDFSSRSGEVPEKRYVRCVETELSAICGREGLRNNVLSSLYFGGGTPSIFSPSSIARLIEAVRKTFTPLYGTEVTLEANPDTITTEKLKGFKDAGVGRLSIGMQSLNDIHLRTLGRTHTASGALRSFYEAREAGFTNIGVDLIFGIPGQGLKDWIKTLEEALRLRPEHISLYGLTIEKGTPFHGIYKKGVPGGSPGLPDEDEEASMYNAAIDHLSRGGYAHYEISNLSLPGSFSVHNQRYWQGKPYIGLGASAHSYLPYPGFGRRWWNERGPDDYMKMTEKNGGALAGSEELTLEDALTEAIMLGLRMVGTGIRGEDFKRRFGVLPKEAFKSAAALEAEGFLSFRGDDLMLTRKGLLLSNEVFAVLAGNRASRRSA